MLGQARSSHGTVAPSVFEMARAKTRADPCPRRERAAAHNISLPTCHSDPSRHANMDPYVVTRLIIETVCGTADGTLEATPSNGAVAAHAPSASGHH